MRIAFVGAVEGSLVAFDALVEAGMAPALLVTLPPEAASRHSDFVDLAPHARAAGADIHFTRNVNAPETIEALEAAELDLTLVIGWSQICREPFRQAARLGTLGYHPAPLPRFRGRAVIPWTIIAGEASSGSTLFWLDAGVDSGPIIAQKTFPVAPDETARSLYGKHKRALAEIVVEAVSRIAGGDLLGSAQNHDEASYCAKRTAEDGLIDWHGPADAILRLIRAVGDPYPGAFTFEGERRLVVDAARPHAPRGRYVGLVGQVQTLTDGGFTVLCGDGTTIEVTAWRSEGEQRPPKVHSKLAGPRYQAAAAAGR